MADATVQQIRERARRDAAATLDVYWPEGITPVDPVKIARDIGIQVYQATLDGDAFGMLRWSRGGAEMFLDRQQAPVRMRFTAAHEVGHYVDRTSTIDAATPTPSFVDRRSDSDRGAPVEVYANEFAGSLLMPEPILRSHIADGMTDMEMSAQFGVNPNPARETPSASATFQRLTAASRSLRPARPAVAARTRCATDGALFYQPTEFRSSRTSEILQSREPYQPGSQTRARAQAPGLRAAEGHPQPASVVPASSNGHMPIADLLTPEPNRRPCLIGAWAAKLDGDDATTWPELVTHLRARELPTRPTYLGLRAQGMPGALISLQRHLSAECGCDEADQ